MSCPYGRIDALNNVRRKLFAWDHHSLNIADQNNLIGETIQINGISLEMIAWLRSKLSFHWFWAVQISDLLQSPTVLYQLWNLEATDLAILGKS